MYFLSFLYMQKTWWGAVWRFWYPTERHVTRARDDPSVVTRLCLRSWSAKCTLYISTGFRDVLCRVPCRCFGCVVSRFFVVFLDYWCSEYVDHNWEFTREEQECCQSCGGKFFEWKRWLNRAATWECAYRQCFVRGLSRSRIFEVTSWFLVIELLNECHI